MKRGDKLDTVWALPPHTAAKHQLLRHYLGAWYPILSRQGRVIVLDGFAGPGVYAGGEPGSPRIVMDTLLQHHHAERMADCEFVLVFNEGDDERFAVLERTVQGVEDAGRPKNVRIEATNQSFSSLAEDILESLGARPMAPIFAFVDPFGYCDVPIDLLARLLDFPKSELFIYFDFNSVNRFSTSGVVDARLEALFGTDEFKAAPPSGDPARGPFLHDLYKRQLEEVVGFRYVRSFRMLNETGHGYYLFFCTQSLDGLDKMKQAMWSVAPSGDYTFDDRHAGQITLDIDTTPLQHQLLERFAGQTVGIARLTNWVVEYTPYASTHIKTRTLAPMKKAGLIDVDPPQKQARWYPPGSNVTFKR